MTFQRGGSGGGSSRFGAAGSGAGAGSGGVGGARAANVARPPFLSNVVNEEGAQSSIINGVWGIKNQVGLVGLGQGGACVFWCGAGRGVAYMCAA